MKRLCFLLCGFLPFAASSQFAYPTNYFKSPLDIQIMLAGNFGELRENHFHTGIDITTHGVEGLNVKAAADGYVSRIKVGPWGYGNVLYITHPNGYVTVYGHLKSFNETITNYIGKEQMRTETFEAEVTLQPGEIEVKQGDIIALSGNTGSSGGPHLHFEIRDAKTEDALNPLLFGLPVTDKVAPTPVKILISPAEPDATINGKRTAQKFTLVKKGNDYVLNDSISIYGKVGFAIDAYDKEDLPNGKNGVYSIQLDRNGKEMYAHHLERMPFDKSRYINCFVDYKEYKMNKVFYMRSFMLPNDLLPVYDSIVNDGYVKFNSDFIHHFTYTLKDAFGNAVKVKFKVHGLKAAPANAPAIVTKPFDIVLLWGTPNKIEESAFRLESEALSFYQNEELNFTVNNNADGIATSVTFDSYIPIQKACTLTWFAKTPEDAMKDKTILVMKDRAGKVSSVGGTWNAEGISAEIKEFGTFYLATDTTRPVCKPSNFDLKTSQDDLSSLKTLDFTMSDNLSGVESFRGTIDGKWVLFKYEPKKKLIWYTFDDKCGAGKHELKLEVTDKCGNKVVYTKSFTR